MNKETVYIPFDVVYRFKDFHYLKLTKDKRIIDCKKSKFLVYGDRGYFINGKHYKRNEIDSIIELIPKFDFNIYGIKDNFLNEF